jgi:hypothetical protein
MEQPYVPFGTKGTKSVKSRRLIWDWLDCLEGYECVCARYKIIVT